MGHFKLLHWELSTDMFFNIFPCTTASSDMNIFQATDFIHHDYALSYHN